uniref:Uncharacterized protein n=1 Tax=Arundo donax TaxID=35708 RepID=A0A0A9G7K4_ARUDO
MLYGIRFYNKASFIMQCSFWKASFCKMFDSALTLQKVIQFYCCRVATHSFMPDTISKTHTKDTHASHASCCNRTIVRL